MSNAVKFTEQGQINIVAKIYNKDNLEVSISDTGIGINTEDLAKLFLPFQQVNLSQTKKHEGTGLGLYLSKKLVNLLGGNITVDSEYGKGSQFTVTIPIKYQGEIK